MSKKIKNFLHKFFKIFIILFIIVMAINVLILVGLRIHHSSKLKKEKGYLMPPGQMVEIDGKNMHVVVSGDEESDITLVFLHSNGVTDDSIALQPLFDELPDYKLAYVDRWGTGFSDKNSTSKEIDTILETTRKALEKSGVEAPYILVPNGTAGLEALYWANKYPDEIVSIIGINMNYPAEFDGISEEAYCGFFNYLLTKFDWLGGQRIVKSVYPENINAIYTERQMVIRKALVSKYYYTEQMYEEDLMMVSNASKVKEVGIPEDIPIYIIYANPIMEPYVNEDEYVRDEYAETLKESGELDYVSLYNEEKKDYFSEYDNVTIEELSGPARLYTYNPTKLAELINEFIDTELLQ